MVRPFPALAGLLGPRHRRRQKSPASKSGSRRRLTLETLEDRTVLSTVSIDWISQFGGGLPVDDFAQGTTTDGDGNAYVVGRTGGTLPGQTSAGGYDAFVVKFVSGTLSATLSEGSLTVTDIHTTGKNNNVTVKLYNDGSNDYIEITDANEQFTDVPSTTPASTLTNGDKTLRVPLSAIPGSISVNSAAANDLLIVDLGSGNVLPAGGQATACRGCAAITGRSRRPPSRILPAR